MAKKKDTWSEQQSERIQWLLRSVDGASGYLAQAAKDLVTDNGGDYALRKLVATGRIVAAEHLLEEALAMMQECRKRLMPTAGEEPLSRSQTVRV